MSDPNHHARLKQIVALYKAGQKSEAQRLIGEIVKANPKDADGWYIAGQVIDERSKKIKAFERALAINPSHQAARTALNNLREAHDLLGIAFSDSDGLLDDIGFPSASLPAISPPAFSKMNIADPKILAGMVAATLVFGMLLGALCLGTVNSGRFLGVVFAPTVTPSKTPTPTSTPTPSNTPTPTLDTAATATSLASTQQYFDSTSTMEVQLQANQQFSQTVTAAAVLNQQIETAIAGTAMASNPSASVTTFTPSTNNQQLPVLPLLSGAYTPVDFQLVAADYSSTLDRIIFVSASPNQLHIFDPNTSSDTVVDLSSLPNSLSVSPDGLFAAVGHNRKISYVDLQNARVLTMLDVTGDLSYIALGDNDWIYASPRAAEDPTLHAINIANNIEIERESVYFRNNYAIRLHPDGIRLYAATRNRSPSDIVRFSLVDNFLPLNHAAIDSPYHGEYEMCSNLWFSADGFSIFTACGAVFLSSDDSEQDMVYKGLLGDITSIASLVDVPATKRIMAVSQTEASLSIWDNFTYETISRQRLPEMTVAGIGYPVNGRYIFANKDGTQYYIIVQGGQDRVSNLFALLVGSTTT